MSRAVSQGASEWLKVFRMPWQEAFASVEKQVRLGFRATAQMCFLAANYALTSSVVARGGSPLNSNQNAVTISAISPGSPTSFSILMS